MIAPRDLGSHFVTFACVVMVVVPYERWAAFVGTISESYFRSAEGTTMATRKFDTFIFDLDGTLLDTLPDLVLLANRILRDVGYPERSESEILSFVGNGVRRLMYQALPEGAPEDVTDRAMQIWNDHFQEYYEHTFPYPGVMETLHELRLRGVRIGVVSNKLQAGVDQIVSVRLSGMVDDMLGESPAVPRKPDPTGINMMIRALGSVPEKTVYVGDSAGDMRAAHNAGLFAIAVRWGYNDPDGFTADEEIPNAIVGVPEELLAYAYDPEADSDIDGVIGADLHA